MTTPTLQRALLIGAGLSAGAVVLFFVLWGVFGSMGMPNFPRLMLSLCLPPLTLTLIVGGYALVKQGQAANNPPPSDPPTA
jgi:hypothetical protein